MSTRLDLSKLSLMDALDLAKLIEKEAYQRYQTFAAQFGASSGDDAGAFFAMMARNEAKHGKDLEARRNELFGDVPANVKLDDLYDVEAPDVGAPHRGMSVLAAYKVGLAAERKAFDFYDSALAGINDPDVRELFIELRDEEVEHVEMLQAAMAKLPEDADQEVEYDQDETPFL